jgi:GNAT superfamily N-acetyltransferase
MLTTKFLVISNFRCAAVRNFSFANLFSAWTKKEEQEIKPVGYQIQNAKAADIRPTLDFIEKHFFKTDPLSKSLNLTQRSLEGSVEVFVLDALKQGLTLIAKSKESEEIIGACVNIRSCHFDASKYLELAKCTNSTNSKKLFHIWSLLAREPRLHEDLNERCIFEVKMLTVKDIHQGQGIGTELLKKSLELARDSNFSYASMNCTSEYAKKIAEKQEMKPLWEVAFKNILLSDRKTPVSTPEHPHLSASVSYLNLKKLE